MPIAPPSAPGKRGTLSWKLSLVALLWPLGATAQEGEFDLGTLVLRADGIGASIGTAETGYRVEDGITATRTGTPLENVPQSVSVVPREVIEEQNATSLTEAVTNASGVVPGNTRAGQAEVFNIRGFSVERYAVDGILLNPLSERPQGIRDTAGVARVEVLKGPSSVLYGQGQPGGLVNIVTLLPEFEPGARVSVQAGSHGLARIEGTGTRALSDTLAGRLSFAAQTEDGWRDEVFRDAERIHLAPSLRWQPSAATELVFDLEYLRQTVPFDRGLVAFGDAVPFDPELELGESYSRQTDEYASATWRLRHEVNDWLTLRHSGRLDRGVNERDSVDPRDVVDEGRTLERRYVEAEERFDALNLRFEGLADLEVGGVGHRILFGYEYNTADTSLPSYRRDLADLDLVDPVYGARPTGPRELRVDLEGEADLHSVYVQDQVDLGPSWTIVGGLRLDSVDQHFTDLDRDDSLGQTSLSPRLGAVYRPSDSLSLYASYSEGFDPQSGLDRGGDSFSPEESRAYEVGAKYDLVPDRVSATLAFYEITKQNVLTPDPVDDTFAVATGEQRSRGVELDLAGELRPGWDLILAAAYTDAEVTRDEGIEIGNRLGGVPRLAGRVWSVYEVQDGPFQGLGLGGGLLAIGERQGDLDNSFSVPGFVRADATAYYDFDNGTRFSIHVENLGDIDYFGSVAGRREVVPGAPLTVGARLSANF